MCWQFAELSSGISGIYSDVFLEYVSGRAAWFKQFDSSSSSQAVRLKQQFKLHDSRPKFLSSLSLISSSFYANFWNSSDCAHFFSKMHGSSMVEHCFQRLAHLSAFHRPYSGVT